MFPGMNPKQMQQAMKQLGIKQEDLDVTEVIIRLKDREIVLKEPSVQKIKMQGQESYQIAGDSQERALTSDSEEVIEVTEEDIETVMTQAGCSRDQALEALEEAEGDLAMAVLLLTNK